MSTPEEAARRIVSGDVKILDAMTVARAYLELVQREAQLREALEVAAHMLAQDDNIDKAAWDQICHALASYDPRYCPGHVASESNPKVCAYCGTHINDERPEDDGAALAAKE